MMSVPNNNVPTDQNICLANKIPLTVLRQKYKGWTLEYTFGIISPKNKRRKVNKKVIHIKGLTYEIQRS